ncbi:hypothetical protein TYRP_015616 [Tyrophagus putrescentiae]|nr:hypothetical protein TYRP_015616 [Tyrophagus putrescentiae]
MEVIIIIFCPGLLSQLVLLELPPLLMLGRSRPVSTYSSVQYKLSMPNGGGSGGDREMIVSSSSEAADDEEVGVEDNSYDDSADYHRPPKRQHQQQRNRLAAAASRLQVNALGSNVHCWLPLDDAEEAWLEKNVHRVRE